MPSITAIIFDAYGTLLDVHAAMARHAARIGPNWPAISADWRAKQLEYTWVRSLAGPEHHRDFWRLTEEALAWAAARHGLTDASLLIDVLLAYRQLDAYPEVPDVLSRLGGMGIQRAILSNGEPGMLGDAVRAARIDIGLDAVLSIETVGVFKPDPRVYQPGRGLLRRRRRRTGVRLVQPVGCIRRGKLRLPGVLAEPRRSASRIRFAQSGNRADRPRSPARPVGVTPAARIAAAIDLLAAIETSGTRPADAVANDYFRARRFIGGGDRRAVSDRVWQVLRTRRRLGWWLHGDASPRLLVAASLLLEGGALGGVASAFSGGRFAPAPLTPPELSALRRLEGHSLEHRGMPDAVRLEVPDWLLPRLAKRYGAALESELQALLPPAPLDLRVNLLKTTREAAQATLAAEGLDATPTRLSPWGLRIANRRPVTGGAAFKAGLIEIQDEGSQLVNGCTWVLPLTSGYLDGQTMTAGKLYSLTGAAATTALSNGAVANKTSFPSTNSLAIDTACNVVLGSVGPVPSLRVIAESTGTYYDKSMVKGDAYVISGGTGATRTTVPGNATGFKLSGAALPTTPPPFGVSSVVNGALGDLLLTDGRRPRPAPCTR